MADSLRDAIASAMDTESTDSPAQDTAPVDTSVDTSVDTAAPEPAAEAPAGEKVRDALGRFVAKTSTTSDEKAPDAPPAEGQSAPAQADQEPPPTEGQDGPIPAPTAWSAAAREEWAKVPAGLQQYLAQREQGMQRFASEAGRAREFQQRFQELVQPYMPAIQLEGVDPLTAARNLFDIANTLRFAPQAQKAAALARVVNAYGVDIQALDSALAGVAPAASQGGLDSTAVQREVQNALAPLLQAAQARQYQTQQQQEEAARSELATFAADPKREFFGDVRGMMADMIEVASRNGIDMPLAEAYDRACALHPEVQKVIMARQQASTAQNLTANAQRAKAAAVQVKGAAPVGNPNGVEPTSVRSAIESAIAAHSRY